MSDHQASEPKARDAADPRGLIREAFRIEGIAEADCRSIFFDWALGMGVESDTTAAVETLLERYADAPADHPMRQVLLEAVNRRPGFEASAGGRRSGRRRANARRFDDQQ